MPTFRSTLFFNASAQNVGWTETWFLGSDDWSEALAVMDTYIAVRIPVLLSTAQIVYSRVANVDHPRDSKGKAITSTLGGGLVNVMTHPSAGTEDCLLYRKDHAASQNFFNKLFLHYVPEEIFAGRVYLGAAAPAPWPTNIAAYEALVADPGTEFLVRQGPLPGSTFQNLDVFEPQRRSAHKVGRPFGLVAGRRAIA